MQLAMPKPHQRDKRSPGSGLQHTPPDALKRRIVILLSIPNTWPMTINPIRLFLSTAILALCLSGGLTSIQADHHEKLLRHVVSFKYKEGTTEEQIAKVEKAFAALKKTITEIKAFEKGTNNSPEGLNKGFEHCYLLTFYSEKDREIYLKHPDHVKFGKMLGPVLADVFVIDYWAKH